MQTLMRVALGEEPADLVVLNADLVNVLYRRNPKKTWEWR